MTESKEEIKSSGKISIRVIDTHLHLCDPSVNKYSWEKICPELFKKWEEKQYISQCEIEKVTSQFVIEGALFVEVDAIDPEKEFEWISKLTSNNESVVKGIIPSIPLELGVEHVQAYIEKITKSKLVGVRRQLQLELQLSEISKPKFLEQKFLESLEYLAINKYPFDICIYQHQLNDILEMVNKTPKNIYVLDHLGKPSINDKEDDFIKWSIGIEQLAMFENVYCKLSPGFILTQEAKYDRYINHAIKCFGTHRLVVGSDWFFSEAIIKPIEWFEKLLNIFKQNNFSDKIIDDIFSSNAKRIYKF